MGTMMNDSNQRLDTQDSLPIDEYQRGRRAGITEFYDSLYALDKDRALAALHKIEPQPAPGAGDQVQMILKHRLMRKVEGDWLAASEFMTGEPDPSWLAKTEESPEEWRIEQARRVSGEQIQAGLTRAFASCKKPAPAAVAGKTERWNPLDGGNAQTALQLTVVIGNRDIQPSPEAQDDAKDAARYRWLRDPTTDVALVLDKRTGYVPADEQVPGVGDYYTYEYRAGIELDAAIDAAIAADKKEPT